MTGQPEDVAVDTQQHAENKYAHLPPQIRREDLRTSQDVVAHDDPVGEYDRERDWLLRTAGIFW
jgi:hypothetical protein